VLPPSVTEALQAFAAARNLEYGGFDCLNVPAGGAGLCHHNFREEAGLIKLLLGRPASDHGWQITLEPLGGGQYTIVAAEELSP
jgi:hypothetical protein